VRCKVKNPTRKTGVWGTRRELLRRALELGLTSYDAMYIDLALTENLPLATLDKGLRAAAAKAGVALLK
jgi:predicted nucleic acid-binding protein